MNPPGLSAAPAIGAAVADMVKGDLKLKEKEDFIPVRKGIINPQALSFEERQALIKEKPEYGQIICRCEMISEGEILMPSTVRLGPVHWTALNAVHGQVWDAVSLVFVLRERWRYWNEKCL